MTYATKFGSLRRIGFRSQAGNTGDSSPKEWQSILLQIQETEASKFRLRYALLSWEDGSLLVLV